jgi:hypothetical protein
MLANPRAARAFAEGLAKELALKQGAQERGGSPAERKTEALKSVAEQYGLAPEGIDRAVRAWQQARQGVPPDPSGPMVA